MLNDWKLSLYFILGLLLAFYILTPYLELGPR